MSDASRRTFGFRTIFLAALLGLVAATSLLIGLSARRHATFTALDLSDQLVDQTRARVDEQVQKLVDTAVRAASLSERLIASGIHPSTDFENLVPYFREVLTVDQALTGMFVGVESTGESAGVSRLNGKLSVWQSTFDPKLGVFEERNFWPEQYPHVAYEFDPTKHPPDIRTRPWYALVRDRKRAAWTDTYLFLGVSGVSDAQGVTYASPAYDPSGTLLAVIDADFDLRQLSVYLQSLRIAKTGFAFVVERRSDGTDRLIAHPDLALLAASIAAGAIQDGRVRALVEAGAERASVHFEHAGARYIGGYHALTGRDPPPWRIGVVLPEAEVLERVERSSRSTAWIAAIGLLVSALCGAWIARQVARPLERLTREMSAIAELKLEARPVVPSVISEVDRVARTVEDIKRGLREKNVLEKYVPKGARADIAKGAGTVELGGARVRKAILFSDLRGFTSMSERLEPQAVVRLLNVYLEAMTAAILRHGGDINEYIGDAILAVFADAPAAVDAAVAMQRELTALTKASDDEDLRTLRMGIGVHVGEVVEGNIGTVERVKFSVVGDTVNLAARIQDRSREGTFTCIFVSDAVEREVRALHALELIGDLAMKGKAEPVKVFEVRS